MFSYYLRYQVYNSQKPSQIVHFDDFYVNADSIQDALNTFWDYVNPILLNGFSITITFMSKEILPDTYFDSRFVFSKEAKNV